MLSSLSQSWWQFVACFVAAIDVGIIGEMQRQHAVTPAVVADVIGWLGRRRFPQPLRERDDCLPALPGGCLVNAVTKSRNDRLRRADDCADFRVAHACRGNLLEG